MFVTHTLAPFYKKDSKVLILGSMPSIKSRELGFYYAHPRNRFWWVLEKVYNEKIGNDTQSKIDFLTKHHIALFDVIKSCDINSSDDTSIKNVTLNNLTPILKNSNIKVIMTTGNKAYTLYKKYLEKETNIKAIPLPSTSPANNKKDILELLEKKYKIIKTYTDN